MAYCHDGFSYTLHFTFLFKDAHAEDVNEKGRSYLPNTSDVVVPCLSADLLLLLPRPLFLSVDLLLPISLLLLLLPLSVLLLLLLLPMLLPLPLLLLLLLLLLVLLLVPVFPSMLLLVFESLMWSLLSFVPLLVVSWFTLLLMWGMA